MLIGSWPLVRLQPDVSSAAEDPTTTVEVTDDFKENVQKSSKARKSGLFFQRFCENSAAKKTQFLPSAQKLKAIFVQKLKVGAAFI